MNAQTSLFDAPATAGRHRRTDPITSIEAGRTVNATRQRDQILRLLRGCIDGLTADELAARMHPTPHRSSVSSRLAQLHREALVEPFGVRLLPSGRRGQVWFACRVVDVRTDRV